MMLSHAKTIVCVGVEVREEDEDEEVSDAPDVPEWDGAVSEMDEDEFLRQLEEDEEEEGEDEEMEGVTEARENSARGKRQSNEGGQQEREGGEDNNLDESSLPAKASSAPGVEIPRRKPPPQHPLLLLPEIVEQIFLHVPYSSIPDVQLVQSYWYNLIHMSSSRLYLHYVKACHPVLSWPPTPIPGCPQKLAPFKPVREHYLSQDPFTRVDFERYRRAARGASKALISAYHTASQVDRNLPTLESSLRGMYISCRLCGHLHEPFGTQRLHSSVRKLYLVPGVLVCFTGFGVHTLLQIGLLDKKAVSELAAYMYKFMTANDGRPRGWEDVSVAKPPFTRLTLSFEGVIESFQTVQISPSYVTLRGFAERITEIIFPKLLSEVCRASEQLQAKRGELLGKVENNSARVTLTQPELRNMWGKLLVLEIPRAERAWRAWQKLLDEWGAVRERLGQDASGYMI